MNGLYISGAINSPPTIYRKAAFLTVLKTLLTGLILDVAVIVPMAAKAQRMLRAVNLWL